MRSIDINKMYRTRNGMEVKVYAVNPDQEWGVHGAVLEDGVWYQRGWKIDGRYNTRSEHSLDLVEEGE